MAGQSAADKAAKDAAAQAEADAKAAADAAAAVPPGQPTPQPANAAQVAQQRYTDGNEGWELGQRAPKDQWRELGPDGQLTGKPLSSAPKGKYSAQVAIKGQPVTNIVRAELGLDS